mgnify:CR=1 FL=1|tara:strand:+ start:882 stop:1235 length:354 start_codon:yes stop_codon:yes gene_type:complete
MSGCAVTIPNFIEKCKSLNKERDDLIEKLNKNEQERIEQLYTLTEIINTGFDKYDLNNDGFIDYHEYLVYTISNIKKGEEEVERDSNKSDQMKELVSKKEILTEQAIKLGLDDLLSE